MNIRNRILLIIITTDQVRSLKDWCAAIKLNRGIVVSITLALLITCYYYDNYIISLKHNYSVMLWVFITRLHRGARVARSDRTAELWSTERFDRQSLLVSCWWVMMTDGHFCLFLDPWFGGLTPWRAHKTVKKMSKTDANRQHPTSNNIGRTSIFAPSTQ
jgi:hypothetical protein